MPIPSWLLHNLLSDVLYAILIFGGGAGLTYLVQKQPNWKDQVKTMGLFTTALALLVYCLVGLITRPKVDPLVTEENAETNVKAWLEDFSLSNKKTDDPATDWEYLATLNSGNGILIQKRKDHPHYIVFQGSLALAPEHVAVYQRLTQAQATELNTSLALQMSLAKMNFQMALPGGIIFSERIPIGTNLTEDNLMRKLDDMDGDMNAGKALVIIALAPYNQPLTITPASASPLSNAKPQR